LIINFVVGIWQFLSYVPCAVWVTFLWIILSYLLVKAIRTGFLRVETAIRDLQWGAERPLARPLSEERLAPNTEGGDQSTYGRGLPEAWYRTDLLWTEETVKKLRQWLLEHPDDARVWRIANPSGFRLWAELLGPDVIRRIWPEEFPEEGASRSKASGH
jgi:hypothetical protein